MLIPSPIKSSDLLPALKSQQHTLADDDANNDETNNSDHQQDDENENENDKETDIQVASANPAGEQFLRMRLMHLLQRSRKPNCNRFMNPVVRHVKKKCDLAGVMALDIQRQVGHDL